MTTLERRLLQALIFEIVNDRAWAHGTGTLAVERDGTDTSDIRASLNPDTSFDKDENGYDVDDDDWHLQGLTRDNPRTRMGV